jgi:anti-anti-sigma factor
MEMIVKKEKNATVVSVKGKMDAVSSPELQKQLVELIDTGERNFVVDLGELEYISSSGLRALLAIKDNLEQKEGRLFLCALSRIRE